ncbi:MAG: hypothetical protein HY367_02230 [Candidatus Aenigmarchaeota archaeon]|nr:hypothetical protein [Candidatus Aenigmarchaeota archaeon]
MKTYAKGAAFERELIHFFHSKGFSCVRAASSGGDICPADIIAIKKSLIIAIECKSWKDRPRLDSGAIRRYKEWCERANAMGFLAWQAPKSKHRRWRFLTLKDAEENKYEDENWFELDSLLKALDFR